MNLGRTHRDGENVDLSLFPCNRQQLPVTRKCAITWILFRNRLNEPKINKIIWNHDEDDVMRRWCHDALSPERPFIRNEKDLGRKLSCFSGSTTAKNVLYSIFDFQSLPTFQEINFPDHFCLLSKWWVSRMNNNYLLEDWHLGRFNCVTLLVSMSHRTRNCWITSRSSSGYNCHLNALMDA